MYIIIWSPCSFMPSSSGMSTDILQYLVHGPSCPVMFTDILRDMCIYLVPYPSYSGDVQRHPEAHVFLILCLVQVIRCLFVRSSPWMYQDMLSHLKYIVHDPSSPGMSLDGHPEVHV